MAKNKEEEIKPIGKGAFGNIYDQFKGKAKEAIAFLLAKRGGEAIAALHHKDVGDIDLVWGKEGTAHSDGFGLAKLAKFHPEVLSNLQELLDDMVVTSRSANRVQLESEKYRAAIRLTWDNQSKTWLLTMFEKENSALSNTTDTDKTLSGNGNDTATPESTVISSADKDTEKNGNGNGAEKKVEDGNEPADNSRRTESGGGQSEENTTQQPTEIGNNSWGKVFQWAKGKVVEAANFLKNAKSGYLKGVFYRSELGDIDLFWGDDKGGLAHIIAKHVIEHSDFASVNEAVSVIDDVISTGEIIQQPNGRIAFVKDGKRVVTERTLEGNWVVTAFDETRKQKEKKRSEEDATRLHQDIFGKENGELVSPNSSSADKDTDKNGNTNELGEKIAKAEAETNTTPTDAQKEAGNYKKGHVQVGTFDITIENPKGSERKGTDAKGNPWSITMQNTYGYFRGTEGVDGDHIDVFLADDIDGWNGRKVFVVDQTNTDGTFDEHKVMLGFNDADEAESAYYANYSKGWRESHPKNKMTAVNLEDFEKWIGSSHRKTKAFAEYADVVEKKVAKEKKKEGSGGGEAKDVTFLGDDFAEEAKEEDDKSVDIPMDMATAKKLIESAFHLNKDYYEDKTVEEWVANHSDNEIGTLLENEFQLYNTYLQNLKGYDESFFANDIVRAYRDGTLQGEKRASTSAGQRMDMTKAIKVSDKRFYAPKEIRNAKKIFSIAMQRMNRANREEVMDARAQILLYAHNKNAAETLGITESRLNGILRTWSHYSAGARDMAMRVNAGIERSNRWTGIENMSYLVRHQVTTKDIDRMVKEVIGDSNETHRSYIARTIMGLDTHIDWSGITFKFVGNKQVNKDYGSNKIVDGFYRISDKLIEVGNDHENTVAHEMGHALDDMWATELGYTTHFLSRNNYVREGMPEQVRQFVGHFNGFVDDLIIESGDNYSDYTQDRAETFARFVDYFIRFTEKISTGREMSLSRYSDRFTGRQVYEFIRLLEEKSMLDSQGLTANNPNGNGKKIASVNGSPTQSHDEKTSRGSSQSIKSTPSSTPQTSIVDVANIRNKTQSAMNNIKKYFNGDYKVETGTVKSALNDLRKLFSMDYKGRSNDVVYNTPAGRVAFRLSDHNAFGNNFSQDNAEKNISVVLEMNRYEVPESTVPYKEFTCREEDFLSHGKEVVAELVNGVYQMMQTGEFPSDTKFFHEEEYPKYDTELSEESLADLYGEETVSKERVSASEGVPTAEEKAVNDIEERANRDGTFMKAPNGKKSRLSERQWVQVRTKAFKAWFGD